MGNIGMEPEITREFLEQEYRGACERIASLTARLAEAERKLMDARDSVHEDNAYYSEMLRQKDRLVEVEARAKKEREIQRRLQDSLEDYEIRLGRDYEGWMPQMVENDLPTVCEMLAESRAECDAALAQLKAAEAALTEARKMIGHTEDLMREHPGMCCAACARDIAAAVARAEKAEAANEHDRSRVAETVAALGALLRGYSWLCEGRGSYDCDDERYQQEFGRVHAALTKALEPLRRIAADWSECPSTQLEIAEARKSNVELRAERDAAVADLKAAKEEILRLSAESAEAWMDDMMMRGYVIDYGGLGRDTPATALEEFRTERKLKSDDSVS